MRIDRVLAPVTWVAAALVIVLLLAGPSLIGAEAEDTDAAAPSGSEVFASSGCGGCHTFAPAGASGVTGPNLDEAVVDAPAVEAVVTAGRGTMPAFGERLSAEEVRAVAAFVAGDEAASPARAGPVDIVPIRTGEGPDGITVAGDGTVWVAQATAGTLAQIPPDADALAGATRVGRQPDSPAVAGDTVWVALSGDDTVARVRDGRVSRVRAGREPSGLVVDGESVWVANAGDGTVTRIDRDAARVRGRPIEVGRRPTDLAVADRVVWVTNYGDGTVTRIDARTAKVVGDPIRVGRRPRGIAIGEGSVWVANAGDGTVSRIDPAEAAVVGGPISVGRNPRELAVGEGFVWVANAADSTVTRIDPTTARVAGEPIPVGEDPIGIAVGGGSVWTADFRADTVTRISPAP